MIKNSKKDSKNSYKDNTKNNIHMIFDLMKGYKLFYIIAIIAIIFSSIIFNSIPFVIMLIIDSVLGDKAFALPQFAQAFIEFIGGHAWLNQNIWFCGLFLVFLSVINGLLLYIKGYLVASVSENVGKKLRDRLFRHILHVPYEFHVKQNAGDIIQRCSSDVENFQMFISSSLIEMANSFMNIFTIVIIMLLINPLLASLSVLLLPIVFFVTFFSFKKMANIWKLYEESEARLLTAIQENISGVRVVKAFGAQAFEARRFEEYNSHFRTSGLNINKPMAIFWSVSDLLTLSQYGVILISGIYFAINGWITIGTFISFLTYSFMLFWPVRHLAQLFINMGQTFVAADRIAEILSYPEESNEAGDSGGSGSSGNSGDFNPEIKGSIEFDNVSLLYDGSQSPILNKLSFKIESGQTVAILGSTGSGKSSIVHLLLRFYDYQGSIKIDGNELRNIDRRWIREKISVVLQEPYLFNKSIKENILFGNENASEDKIYSTSRITSIHESIESFEHRYDTMLGERGMTLSGGQRQRIAIARTLLRDSSILIFDDSLSAVDMETDAIIRDELKKHRKEITKIFISHRITTLSNADLIFVLEGGKVTQQGTHNELLAQKGLYQRVCKLQGIIDADETIEDENVEDETIEDENVEDETIEDVVIINEEEVTIDAK